MIFLKAVAVAIPPLVDPLETALGCFSIKGFGQFMSDAIREAGLPAACKAHGLRKAAARRLAEAGCSAHEIMAVTGHKTLTEVERYTRAAEQARLNEMAMEKQFGNTGVANSPLRFGKPVEKNQENIGWRSLGTRKSSQNQ